MIKRTIEGSLFREMLLTGAAWLEKNKQAIDAMNVFPVPDGDTGTNMSMTMQRAVAEIRQVKSDSVEELASALSMGALRGARGNSGVILSQIFRGFSRALKGKKNELDARLLADALTMGTEAAYKAVMKPKEGTMLTVSRLMSDAVNKAAAKGADAYQIIDVMLQSGEAALKKTPDMLPVLKEAGVVDSGGMGLLTIYRGFKMALDGEELSENLGELPSLESKDEVQDAPISDINDIEFGYCTEFFIIHIESGANAKQIEDFREKLMKIGDSVVVVNDEDIIKVHVHSNAPGKVLQLALDLGEIDRVKIENMREQNRELTAKLKASEKELGIVAVSVGDGIDEVFKSLGTDNLISGGQTMNPSIDTIAQAIKKVNARNVFVLPNNPNILLAAQQAAEISDKNVIVIPTRTIVQGVSAVIAFDPEADTETNRQNMTEAIAGVVSGSVTFAVRDTTYNGNVISANDIIGIIDGSIVCVDKTIPAVTEKLIEIMLEKHGGEGVVTLYCGEGTSEDEASKLADRISEKHADSEFIVQHGGQPLYYYYISVE